MAIHRVEVRKSRTDQDYLRNRREHCSVDTQALAAAGVAVGQQVRVRRSYDRYALYTVARDRNENGHKIVRMGLTGRRRLGTEEQFDAGLDTRVVHPTMSDQDAETNSEFVERLCDDGAQSRLIAIGPHGGDIEVHTDEQAERIVSRLADMAASSWLCKGYHEHGAENAWHITSVDIDPESFPLLKSVVARGFTYAVAFHGFAQDGILVGGAGSTALKDEIVAAIQQAIAGSGISVRIAGPDDEFGGDVANNIVNRLSAGGGIQIEQSRAARTGYWREIADAVARVFG